MISVLILTKNEAQDLPACLASVAWSDDIHVFDSLSDDATVAIAKAAGARVVQRPFDNYASQRNAALEQLPYKHEWILILDADERIPATLASELRSFVAHASSEVAAGRLRRRDFFGDKWLKHTQLSPYFIRLVRRGKAKYKREINEVLQVDGQVSDLESPFDHHPFSKGLAHWFSKHNLYSSMEAEQVVRSRRSRAPFSLADALWTPDFNQRRYHQKELFYRLPLRALIKFLFLYFIKRGFMDGHAGFTYAVLQSIYEYLIVLKTRELESKRMSMNTASNTEAPPTSSV